jgi:cytochrome c oxidase subunit 2
MGSVRLLPPTASTFASEYDGLFWFFMISCGLAFVVTFAVMMFFAFRYRRGTGRYVAHRGAAHTWVEVVWSLPVFFVVAVLFVWGARIYIDAYTPPKDAMEIFVTGKQWMWKVQHPNGRREINELHIPTQTPIKLTLTSEDVIHSFFIPAFRTKRDVLPGRYTDMWFEATESGQYHLFCAEYCGTEHSRMVGRVIAMEPDDYQNWVGNTDESAGQPEQVASLSDAVDEPEEPEAQEAEEPATEADAEELRKSMVQAGEQLFQMNACAGCHYAGEGAPCPDLEGIWKSKRPMADGTSVVADENYIRESILNPQAKVVMGYAPVMPSFQGRIDEEGINQLIAYIKSLDGGSGGN